MEKQIKKIMDNLKVPYSEAIKILKADKAIDKGIKLFELSDEQKKVEKTMRKVKVVSPNGKKTTRPLKIDNNRELLIVSIIELLKEKFMIQNIERPSRTTNKIQFIFKDDIFNITIAKQRERKK